METSNVETRRLRTAGVWMTILLLGSVWGFSEVVLNGAIRAAGLPYRSGILTGIGMGLLAIAVAMFGKPVLSVPIALVAILVEQLAVPILRVSPLCKPNSCLAVLLESFALAGTVALAGRMLHRSNLARTASGASAAFLAAGAFYFLGLRLVPCQYLLSFNRTGGLQAFLAVEGVPWAIFSAMLFPVGWRVGTWLRGTAVALRTRKPIVYYAASALLVVACWLASGVAIAAGW